MGLPPFQETSKYSHSVGHNCWSCQSTHCEILCTVRRKGSWTLRWSRVSTIQEQFETPQVPATLCNFHISIYIYFHNLSHFYIYQQNLVDTFCITLYLHFWPWKFICSTRLGRVFRGSSRPSSFSTRGGFLSHGGSPVVTMVVSILKLMVQLQFFFLWLSRIFQDTSTWMKIESGTLCTVHLYQMDVWLDNAGCIER